MIQRKSIDWEKFLKKSLNTLIKQKTTKFLSMCPADMQKKAGVYLIISTQQGKQIPYYIGRTKNLQRRLYRDHLMGHLNTARLKKRLIKDKICLNKKEAKSYLRLRCTARWIEEADYRKRGAIEGYCTAMLFPKYGIDEER